MTVKQLDEYIKNKPLRYKIIDSTFVANEEPGAILDQSPKAGEKVKRNRRIYLTINSQVPPKTKLPNLYSTSLKNAEIQLKNAGLLLGDVKKQACLGKTVELMKVKGKIMQKGMEVPKGSKVDLIVCDGIGNRRMEIPDLLGLPYTEAVTALRLSELSIGAIILNSDVDYKEDGFVFRQTPAAVEGNSILVGEAIDIFLQKDPPEIIEDPFGGIQEGKPVNFEKYQGKKGN